MSKIFSDYELINLSETAIVQAVSAITAADYEKAKIICQANKDYMKTEYTFLYHMMRDKITYFLSHIGRKYGDEELLEALRYSVGLWWRPLYDKWQDPLQQKKGGHDQGQVRSFRSYIEEDGEKVTKRMLCTSGALQVKQGRYDDPSWNFLRVKKAQSMTFGRENIPVYCCHCAVAHGILSIEWGGFPVPAFEPDNVGKEPCISYRYKDPCATPAKYFEAVGKVKTAPRARNDNGTQTGSWYSPSELKEMTRPLMDRIIEALDQRDYGTAKAWLNNIKTSWSDFHLHLYRDWLAALMTFIVRKHGEEECCEVTLQATRICLRPFLEYLKGKPFGEIIRNLATWYRADCSRFQVVEDDEKITFNLQPCGSGGGLINEGAYCLPKNFIRLRNASPLTFNNKDFPVYCSNCAAFSKVLKEANLPFSLDVDAQSPSEAGTCIQYYYKVKASPSI